MRRALFLLLPMALVGATAVAQPVPPAQDATAVVAGLAVAAVYADHPLVAEVASRGWLSLEQRATVLYSELPIDRAWAVVDAVGAEGVRRHAQDRALLLAVAAKGQVGPSGAVGVQDVRTDQLDARSALLLGWVRALASDRATLRQTSDRLAQAGALQLLQLAAKLRPDWQAAALAAAVVEVAASAQPNCGQLAAVLRAARNGEGHAVRLAVAENADRIARTWLAKAAQACPAATVPALQGRIALPAPPPETAPPAHGQRPPPPPDRGAAPPGDAFVAAAPVFRGWMHDPTVRKMVLRTPLDDPTLFAALQQDPTADIALATINAAYHARRTGAFNLADLTWRAVVRAQGLAEAPEEQQNRLKLSELTPQQALILGYGLALGSGARQTGTGAPLALQATASALFQHARGGLPLDAKLGPVLMLGHLIDREPDKCAAARRAEALRVIVAKTDLPLAARSALTDVLLVFEKACPAAPVAP